MSTRANVKPLMHWLIYRGYTVRISKRTPSEVEGVMTTPDGPIQFRYEPTAQLIHLPEQTIAINEYGWEIDLE
jgi:hypothetical protein